MTVLVILINVFYIQKRLMRNVKCRKIYSGIGIHLSHCFHTSKRLLETREGKHKTGKESIYTNIVVRLCINYFCEQTREKKKKKKSKIRFEMEKPLAKN